MMRFYDLLYKCLEGKQAGERSQGIVVFFETTAVYGEKEKRLSVSGSIGSCQRSST